MGVDQNLMKTFIKPTTTEIMDTKKFNMIQDHKTKYWMD